MHFFFISPMQDSCCLFLISYLLGCSFLKLEGGDVRIQTSSPGTFFFLESRVISYGIIPRSCLKKLESELPKCRLVVLIFALHPPLWIFFPLCPSESCYPTGLMATAAKAALTFISLTNYFSSVAIKSRKVRLSLLARWGGVGHGEERLRGIPSMFINTCREGMKKRRPHIFQWCPVKRSRACILEWDELHHESAFFLHSL